MSLDFLEFLRRRSIPCEESVCTTCGGRMIFFREFIDVVPDLDELTETLKTLPQNDDIVRFEIRRARSRSAIHFALESLDEAGRRDVIESWLDEAVVDPRRAMAVLVWTDFGRHLKRAEAEYVLLAADRSLARNRALRRKLLDRLPPDLRLPRAVREDIDDERREEEATRTRAEARVRERNERFSEISRLPALERIRLATSDTDFGFDEWGEERSWLGRWRWCSEDELSQLNSSELQEAIDLLGDASAACAHGSTFQRLLDRRHELRQVAMEAWRSELGGLTPGEQLERLLADESVPIESFPVELAEHVTKDWTAALELRRRARLLDELSRTRLRSWKRALRLLEARSD